MTGGYLNCAITRKIDCSHEHRRGRGQTTVVNLSLIHIYTGKAGGCPSQSEATARLASVALRSGMDVHTIIDQLKGIRCPSTIRQHGLKCTSCPDAIAKTIEKVYEEQIALGHWAAPSIRAANIPTPVSQAQKPKKFFDTEVQGQMRYCPECGDVYKRQVLVVALVHRFARA